MSTIYIGERQSGKTTMLIEMSEKTGATIVSRRHHKLDEWHTLCDRIESLPYSALITGTAV